MVEAKVPAAMAVQAARVDHRRCRVRRGPAFTVFYALTCGSTKVNEWLSSFAIGFAQSVLIVEPLKVRARYPGEVAGLTRKCFDGYSMMSEDDGNYTEGWTQGGNFTKDKRYDEAWQFQSTVALSGMPYWGLRATYGGGGFVADIGTSIVQARRILTKLREHSWIDHQTRVVIAEFTIFNPYILLFTYVNYMFEMPPTGAVIPNFRIRPFQVYMSMDAFGMFLFLCQIIYLILLAAYFRNFWNIFEITLIIASTVGIAMFVMREILGRVIQSSLKKNREGFTNYLQFASYDDTLSYVLGFIVFLAYLKFLKLLRFNKHIVYFVVTLKMCRVELSTFIFTFFIVVLNFSMFGTASFGLDVADFSTIINSMQTLFSMCLGKFEFSPIKQSDEFYGPIFFIAYMVLVFFIIVNMLLGIIGDTYKTVSSTPGLVQDDVRLVNFIMSKLRRIIQTKEIVSEEEDKEEVDLLQ